MIGSKIFDTMRVTCTHIYFVATQFQLSLRGTPLLSVTRAYQVDLATTLLLIKSIINSWKRYVAIQYLNHLFDFIFVIQKIHAELCIENETISADFCKDSHFVTYLTENKEIKTKFYEFSYQIFFSSKLYLSNPLNH